MINTSKIVLILFLVIMASCTPMSVRVISDTAFDVSHHSTYSLIGNEQDDLINLPLEKSVIDNIITESLDAGLTLKGYKKSSENPGIFVTYYLVTNTKTNVYIVDHYYESLGYLPPGRSSTRNSYQIKENTFEEGILIVDIINARTKERVWQAYLTSRIGTNDDKEKREKRLRSAVTKIINYLPSAVTSDS